MRTGFPYAIGLALLALAVTGVIPDVGGVIAGAVAAAILVTGGGRRLRDRSGRSGNPRGGAAEAMAAEYQTAAHATTHHRGPYGGSGGV